ncbi:MAG: copper ion binding protein [Prevotella sp.]|nr:copper ion binding protein [Prevotella sp.]
MRKFLFMALALLGATVSASATDTLIVRINGMKCGECAHKVKTVLKKVKGFEGMTTNLERRTATISYDPAQTCADTIKARLEATGRYKARPYDPNAVIRRGMGIRVDDMHCKNCANRITKFLQKLEGVDSIAPHVDKHYVFVRYDANRTAKDSIKALVTRIGYTPVNYYTSNKVSFAYYNIPEAQATPETLESVLALKGVEDVNVNAKRKSMAVTFFNDESTAETLLAGIKESGIEATLPPAHVCKEEQEGKKH